MNLLQEVQKIAVKKVPKIEPGLTVRVHQKIREGEKERIQIFEGLVIKVNSGHGADKTFTVRKVVEGIGVEKVFPLYSAAIEKIEVLKKSKIRRAKLYYMRERSGKSARLKETFVKNKAEEEEEVVVETAEAPEAPEAPEANESPEAAVEPAEVHVEAAVEPAEAEAPEANDTPEANQSPVEEDKEEPAVEDKAEEDKKE